MSPLIIITGYWRALQAAREKLNEYPIKINDKCD